MKVLYRIDLSPCRRRKSTKIWIAAEKQQIVLVVCAKGSTERGSRRWGVVVVNVWMGRVGVKSERRSKRRRKKTSGS